MEESIKREALDKNRLNLVSPLLLAYMGDSVYEVSVRRHLIENTPDFKPNEIHKTAIKYVKAKAQSEIVKYLMEDFLSQEECSVVKRGRNQKSGTIPKNAQVTDYKYATGFEALIGYLYLTGEYKRMDEIIEKSIYFIEKNLNK